MRYCCPFFMDEFGYEIFSCNHRPKWLRGYSPVPLPEPARETDFSVPWVAGGPSVASMPGHILLWGFMNFPVFILHQGARFSAPHLFLREGSWQDWKQKQSELSDSFMFMKTQFMKGCNCLYLTGRWGPLKIEKARKRKFSKIGSMDKVQNSFQM